MSLELVKVFDHQTSRVKGLSFHPRRPWVIVSLHTGIIQLWDYHHGLLLSCFNEHEGPIRSVSFHSTQNIFASGGDDAKIKVWNCQSQTLSASSTASSDAASSRSLFTLTGHTDYIRSVSFHNESPWILSASDDQTIRIWNWQSRQCLSILTGHNHYVMNAAFSPLGDMIASCSLDQTVRIWDITGLLRKSSASSGTARGSPSSSPSSSYPDLFAPSEVVVKHIIEGHERGINFVSWHPSGQMLLSASDDRLVKVWQLDAFRAWEVDTYSGHFNNVSSAVFAYHGDIIISNSEDRTLRVWDTHSKACILNFRRDNDRFWFVSGYPNTAPESQMMIFGAAHDNGFSIFKLEKDTPAFTAINDDGHESSFLYVSSGCSLNFVTCALSKAPEKKSIGVLVSDEKSTTNTLHLGESPTSISLNPVDGSILAVYKKESKSHCELFPNVFIPQPPGSSSHQFIGMITSVLKLPALSAVFLSRNRFVVLDEAGSSILLLSSSDKNFSKRIITCVTCDNLFSSTIPNSVYLTSSATDRILLFDVQQERIVSEHSSVFFSGSPILFCCSSERSDFVAFGSKTGIMVLTKKLEKSLSNIQCNSNHIESMALDDKDHPGTAVLYYSTFYNINYALVSGDSGIVLQTPSPMFVTGISKGNSLGAIDRRGVFQLLDFDPTEIRFKYSLACRDYRTLSSIISSGNLVGQSMISFLCRKGHPKLALKYVKDTQTRFDLALECLDIDMALTMAQKLDLCSCWENLAKEAMLHGRVHVVEECYRRLLTSNYEEYSFKLLFLWILTGQLDKIRRFWKENSSGPSTPIFDFICAFVSADKDGIVEMLQASGQHMLAFAFSAINGMVDGSGVAQVNDDQKKRVFNFIASCSVGGAAERALSAFKPNPKAECEWPTRDLIEKSPEPFSPPHHHHHHDLMQETSTLQTSSFVGEEKMCVDGAAKANSPPDTSLVSTEAWGIDDLEFEKQQSSIFSSENETAAHDAISRAQCVPGIDPIHNLLSYSSSVAADHIVIGNFEAAMMEKMLSIFATSRLSLSCTYSLLPMDDFLSLSVVTPPCRFAELLYDRGLSLTTSGKFVEALGVFSDALQYCCLFIGSAPNDDEALKNKCREYILGLSIELARRSLSSSEAGPSSDTVGKCIGLSFLFTQCGLEAIHLLLTLRSALSLAIKSGNYRMGALFARKLVHENQHAPSNIQLAQNVISQIQKSLVVCEEHVKKSETSGNPADCNPPIPSSNYMVSGATLKYICARTYEAVWSNSVHEDPLVCPFCAAKYHRNLSAPFVCDICHLCKITK